jgi:prepilin-type N-terminal cleavage/methylation domain-containing protein
MTVRPTPTSRLAFTLIELLLVVSIIALLIGLVIPALGQSRETARRVKCLANLRSIGQAFGVYLNESKGLLPNVRWIHDPDSGQTDLSILDVLSPNLGVELPVPIDPANLALGYQRVADVFRCPSDTLGKDPRTNFNPLWKDTGTSYQYGAGFLMDGARQATVRDPAKAVTLTYEMPKWRELPVLLDFDNWHPIRKVGPPRNALFFGDWRSDWAGPIVNLNDASTPVIRDLICDVVRVNGGVPLPGCP